MVKKKVKTTKDVEFKWRREREDGQRVGIEAGERWRGLRPE